MGSSENDGEVTVVIPTTAEASRQDSLELAIQSVLDQEEVRAVPLVVVNGDRFDPATLHQLVSRSDLEAHYVGEGNLGGAQVAGRVLVDRPFFAFLDDDDELLPSAIATRMERMQTTQCDVVASNGYRVLEGQAHLLHDDMQVFAEDPLVGLLSIGNWLPSCGGLFRSDSVTLRYFDPYAQQFEWTLIAFKLALRGLHIEFINQPTFKINDTPGSLSKNPARYLAEIELHKRLLSFFLPKPVEKVVNARLADGYHALATHLLLERGDRRGAWRAHLMSLRSWSGFRRYASFTRYFARQRPS